MSENEWFDVTETPASLPVGAHVRTKSGMVYEITKEAHRIFRNDELGMVGSWRNTGYTWEDRFLPAKDMAAVQMPADDLGDTPEHLRPLLAEARKRVPGALVSDYRHGARHAVVWPMCGDNWGWVVWDVRERSAAEALEGWEEPGLEGGGDPDDLKTLIRKGLVYPTADARRIGREEFGMVFEDRDEPDLDDDALRQRARERFTAMSQRPIGIRIDGGIDVKGKPITWADITIAPSVEAMKRELERAIEQFAAFGSETFKIDDVPRAASITEIPCATVNRDARPTCSQCPKHMDPRHDGDDTCSAECLQAKLREKREAERIERYAASMVVYAKVKKDEKANALNTRYANARRESILAELDRPLPRVSIEHAPPLNPAALPGVCGVRGKRGGPVKAPSTWPEGSGDDDV